MFQPSLFPEDLDHVLSHTRADWEDLRGQRLFLTGGTGFFGKWLIETFLWSNEKLGLDARMLVLSRDPAAFLRKMPHLAGQSALEFQAGDVTSFEFPADRFSHVVHAATEHYDSPMAVDRLAAFDRDVLGARRVLELARQCGASRFLLASSGAVYGRQPADLTHIPEDYVGSFAPSDSQSGYGQAKRVMEFLCTMYSEAFGLETKIARCFAFVGPYLPLDRNFAVGNFLRDALVGGPIVVQGDGTPRRSYLYAADLAVWLWTILFRGRSGCPYNVGSDQDLSIAELAQMMVDIVASSAAVNVLCVADPSRPVSRYVPAIRRACHELGLEASIGLREGIGRMAAWVRAASASSVTGVAARKVD